MTRRRPPSLLFREFLEHAFGPRGAAAFDEHEIARCGDLGEQLGGFRRRCDRARCFRRPALSRGRRRSRRRISPIAIK